MKTGVGFPVKCPADKPYCKFSASAVVNSINIGECSADLPTKQFLVAGAADVDCTSSNDQFVCMQVGFQPNPDNCQKYYYCSTDGVKFTPLGLSCKADKMYNPLTTSCDLLYSPAKCVKIDCTAVKLFSQIPYGTSKQNFAVCAEGPEKEPVPLMFACPDNTVANLTNAFLDVCVYTCVKIGFFPHTLADNLYFECSFENNVWKSKLGICPTAKIFKENKTNPTSFSCA